MSSASRKDFEALVQSVSAFVQGADTLRDMIETGVGGKDAYPLLVELDRLQSAGERAVLRGMRSAWALAIKIAEDEQELIRATGNPERGGEIDAIQRVVLEMVRARDGD